MNLNKCGCGRMPCMVTKGTSTQVDNKIHMIWGDTISDKKVTVICDCGIQTGWMDSEFHAASVWNRAFPMPDGRELKAKDLTG